LRSPELDLEVYQGPFDLLLSLIMKEEVDLLEVPLVEVIAAYLEDMESAGAAGYWEDMTEFLLLMSLLVEVKSRLLLPGVFMGLEDEITPEQARDQLLARLFDYSKFKAAAVALRASGVAAADSLVRSPAGEARRLLTPLEELVGTGDAMELRECIVRLLARKAEPDTTHLVEVKVELRRQLSIVRGMLARHRRFSFNSVFGGEPPLVQALSLFALLELLSRGEIRVSQGQVFGDIVVRSREAQKTG
jgi:segregation and condensation protein A